MVTQPHRVGKGGGPTRPMRVRAVKPWTPEVEAEFLDLLASTCNVLLSAQTVGYPNTSPIYRRRRQDPAFHRAWQAAVAQGYARMEVEYIRACVEALEGREFTERPIGPISAADVHRAAPIAHLFEAGKVLLHGRFPELEAELCGLIAGGDYEGPGASPDRADAMVWALTELCLKGKAEPQVRGL